MRILIIDDHRLFREAIGHVLRELDEKIVLIEAGTAEEAISMVGHYKDLDLILLDLGLPGMGGLSSLPRLLELAPAAPVVVVSGSAQETDVHSAISAGAAGFIPKTASSHELASALRVVLSGEIYIPPSLLPTTGGGVAPAAAAVGTRAISLTPRQSEVLQLMCDGLSNKSIANRLDLSEGTIKLHVNAVLRALNARNRTEAVVEANRRGLLTLDAGSREAQRSTR